MNKREYEIHIIADSDNAIQYYKFERTKIAIKDAASGEPYPLCGCPLHRTRKEGIRQPAGNDRLDFSFGMWHHHFYLSGL